MPEPDVGAWSAALAPVVATPERRAAARQAVRRELENGLPSWRDVVCEDLLPVWRECHRRGAGA